MTSAAPTAPSRETLVDSVDRVTIPEAIGFQLGGEDLDILAQRAPVSFEHGNVIGLLMKSTYCFSRVLSGAVS
jgi:hypothetical protein